MVTAIDWLQEAKNDLAAAKNLGQAKLYALACFHCQQAAEKALKATLIKTTGEFPKSHSLRQLAISTNLFVGLQEELAQLEGDYTFSRYPDAAGKPPAALYTVKHFEQKLKAAKKVLDVIEQWMKN